jgi:hypothetical protein
VGKDYLSVRNLFEIHAQEHTDTIGYDRKGTRQSSYCLVRSLQGAEARPPVIAAVSWPNSRVLNTESLIQTRRVAHLCLWGSWRHHGLWYGRLSGLISSIPNPEPKLDFCGELEHSRPSSGQCKPAGTAATNGLKTRI